MFAFGFLLVVRVWGKLAARLATGRHHALIHQYGMYTDLHVFAQPNNARADADSVLA